MNLPDLKHASRRDLVKEWRRIFKSREPEKAGAKVLRTCLLTHSQRSGDVQACNKAEAKLMSRLKRHEAGDARLSSPSSPISRYRAYAELSRANIYRASPRGGI